MTPGEKADALRAVALFEDLPSRQLRKLSRLAKEVHHEPGHVIVREGSSAHGFHLIVDGEVSVDVDGEVQTVLGPGSFFGEMALIDRGPRSATLTAATSVSALVLDAVDFRRLLLSDARIGYQLLVHVSRRLREAQGSPLD